MKKLELVENKTITTRKGNIRNLYTQTVCVVREVESKDNKAVGELFLDLLSRNCRVFVEVKEKGDLK